MKLFTSLFFTVFLLGFTSNALARNECNGYLTVTIGPDKTESFGDVKVETYDRKKYGAKDRWFIVKYNNQLLYKETAKSCHRLSFNLRFANTGEKIEKPESIYLYFISNSTYRKYGWKSKRRFKVYNGKKLIYTKSLELDRRDVKPYKKSLQNYKETISADVDLTKFEQMAKAKNLSFYLSRSKVKITDKDKKAIKDMAEFINNIK